jgi:hypothetical protein
VAIIPLKGKDKLARNIELLVASNAFKTKKLLRYAVVRDGDLDPAVALTNVQDTLEKFGEPRTPHAQYVPNSVGIDVGTFIIPSATIAGDLERLCLDTIPGDPIVSEVKVFYDKITSIHGQLPNRFKRLAQIYLAFRQEDARGVGRAFHLGVFEKIHPSLDDVRAFLIGLMK